MRCVKRLFSIIFPKIILFSFNVIAIGIKKLLVLYLYVVINICLENVSVIVVISLLSSKTTSSIFSDLRYSFLFGSCLYFSSLSNSFLILFISALISLLDDIVGLYIITLLIIFSFKLLSLSNTFISLLPKYLFRLKLLPESKLLIWVMIKENQ